MSPWHGAQSSFVLHSVRVTLQSVAIFENELGFMLLVTGLGRKKIPRIDRQTRIVTTMQEKYLKKVCNIFFYLSQSFQIKKMNDRIIRLFVIALAVICAYVAYEYLMKRVVLHELCLVDTNDCAWLQYWSYQNTVLVDMQPTGYSIFFDGQTAFTFGVQLSREYICQPVKDSDGKEINYDPAYEVNIVTGIPTGVKCILSRANLLDFYQKNNVQPQNIYVRTDLSKFDVRAIINKLQDVGIINLSTVKNI